jgi:hypothetical protein
MRWGGRSALDLTMMVPKDPYSAGPVAPTQTWISQLLISIGARPGLWLCDDHPRKTLFQLSEIIAPAINLIRAKPRSPRHLAHHPTRTKSLGQDRPLLL